MLSNMIQLSQYLFTKQKQKINMPVTQCCITLLLMDHCGTRSRVLARWDRQTVLQCLPDSVWLNQSEYNMRFVVVYGERYAPYTHAGHSDTWHVCLLDTPEYIGVYNKPVCSLTVLPVNGTDRNRCSYYRVPWYLSINVWYHLTHVRSLIARYLTTLALYPTQSPVGYYYKTL